jgi:hypothetical protein
LNVRRRPIQRRLIERRRLARGHMVVHRLPQALDEPIGALHSLIRPLQGLLRGCGEHGEQARGIRAEFIHQRLRIDAVVLRFGHGDDAARFDLFTVGAQHRNAALSGGIESHFDVCGIEVFHPAGVRLPEEHFVQHHALGEQIGERLLEGDRAQFPHDARPEPRVQQVQNGMLDAADILIHRQPVLNPLVQHGLAVVRTGEAQEIPG